MFNLNDTIEALSLFNEKAEKLKNSTFLKIMLSGKTGYTQSWKEGTEFNTEVRGPDQEYIDAFVLNFRFFILSNEASSFKNLSKIYDSLPGLEEHKKKFIDSRTYLNSFLDKNTTFGIQLRFDDEVLTNRRIMDTVINGGLAHSNDPKAVQTYQLWMQNPFIKGAIHNNFNVILTKVLSVISYVQTVNIEVLNELKKTIVIL